MSWQQPELLSMNHSNPSATYHDSDSVQKPVEIYLFLDPFSADCWSLQFYLRKLTLEYGRFFTVRVIVNSRFSLVNRQQVHAPFANHAEMVSESSERYPVTHPLITSLAIKASELQGKRAGKEFLQKLQEKLFIERLNISELDVLFSCAEETKLDMQEFEKDIVSPSAKRAYQCDLRLTNEMDVDAMPTMVFFNQTVEEHGIKVSGLYPYEIYELVLSEILQYHPIPSTKPSLEELVSRSTIIGTREISIIYDWSETKTLSEMKKLQLKQLVEKVETDNEIYWKPKI